MKRNLRCIQGIFAAAVVVMAASGVASRPTPGWAAVGKGSLRSGLAPWQRCLRASGANKAIARRRGNPDWEANIVVCKEAVRVETEVPKVSFSLGALARAYAGTGELDVATSLYNKAIRLMPDVDLRFSLAEVYRRKGLPSHAIAVYKEIVWLEPDNAAAHLSLGKIYRAQGKWDTAIASYREAIRLKPDSAEAHYGLGEAYRMKGLLDEAVEAYREALLLEPHLADAYYHIGVVYTINERRALADYYLYEAASLYLTQGNRNGALEAYGHLRSLKSPLADKVYKRLYPQP